MSQSQPQQNKDFFIVVDVEASGPSPSLHALLSIGACTVEHPHQTFYVELQPDSEEYIPDALAISRLSLERLAARGKPPTEALQSFAAWLEQVVPPDTHPVFTAFNAPFDWMFINDYFHRYLGYNPFGYKALDIKAYFMGLHDVSWAETSHKKITTYYFGERELSHNALRDAIDEAEILQVMLAESKSRHEKEKN